ncbi:RRS1 [Sanghuangporus weigelae]
MDVSGILAAQAERHNAVPVEKDIQMQLDVGYLTVTDPNPIPAEEHNRELEAHLQSTARDGVQVLLSALLQLPTQSTSDGPLTLLPPPTTLLPRAKPLPKAKAPTKWERFAAAKGIQKKRKDRKVWDEERGEWVARWGKDAKNKEGEGQWITEVKANADVNANPEKELRDARKARVTKNEKQQLQNLTAATRESRKSEIERTLATTRASTASMGKFDRTLEGEKKSRGVKRKFDPTERSVEEEKKASLALISKLDSSGRKRKGGGDDVLNVRKAIRNASKGKGSVALAQERSSKRLKKGSKSKSGKR